MSTETTTTSTTERKRVPTRRERRAWARANIRELNKQAANILSEQRPGYEGAYRRAFRHNQA